MDIITVFLSVNHVLSLHWKFQSFTVHYHSCNINETENQREKSETGQKVTEMCSAD